MPVICGQSFEKELDMDEKSIHFNTGEGWKRYYGFSLSCWVAEAKNRHCCAKSQIIVLIVLIL